MKINMRNGLVYVLVLSIFLSCVSKNNLKGVPNNLIAFIKTPGLDSMSKIDFENEKILQLNSPKIKIVYATAYLHGEGFPTLRIETLQGNSLSPITHIYAFIEAKPPFEITFDDIKYKSYKGKLMRVNGFSIKIY